MKFIIDTTTRKILAHCVAIGGGVDDNQEVVNSDDVQIIEDNGVVVYNPEFMPE